MLFGLMNIWLIVIVIVRAWFWWVSTEWLEEREIEGETGHLKYATILEESKSLTITTWNREKDLLKIVWLQLLGYDNFWAFWLIVANVETEPKSWMVPRIEKKPIISILFFKIQKIVCHISNQRNAISISDFVHLKLDYIRSYLSYWQLELFMMCVFWVDDVLF
jgi:hypothetical protein